MMQTRGWLDWKRYRGEETLAGGNAECWLDWMRDRGVWSWIRCRCGDGVVWVTRGDGACG